MASEKKEMKRIYYEHLEQCPYNPTYALFHHAGIKHPLTDKLGRTCSGQSVILREKLRAAGIDADTFRPLPNDTKSFPHTTTIAHIGTSHILLDSVWKHRNFLDFSALNDDRRSIFSPHVLPNYGIYIYAKQIQEDSRHYVFIALQRYTEENYTSIRTTYLDLAKPNNSIDVDSSGAQFTPNHTTLYLECLDQNRIHHHITINPWNGDMCIETVDVNGKRELVFRNSNPDGFTVCADCIGRILQVTRDELLQYFFDARDIYHQLNQMSP